MRAPYEGGYATDEQVIAHDAISALINLSDTIAAAKYLVEQDFLVWLISYTAVCHPFITRP
jgi:hypothetical protein